MVNPDVPLTVFEKRRRLIGGKAILHREGIDLTRRSRVGDGIDPADYSLLATDVPERAVAIEEDLAANIVRDLRSEDWTGDFIVTDTGNIGHRVHASGCPRVGGPYTAIGAMRETDNATGITVRRVEVGAARPAIVDMLPILAPHRSVNAGKKRPKAAAVFETRSPITGNSRPFSSIEAPRDQAAIGPHVAAARHVAEADFP